MSAGVSPAKIHSPALHGRQPRAAYFSSSFTFGAIASAQIS